MNSRKLLFYLGEQLIEKFWWLRRSDGKIIIAKNNELQKFESVQSTCWNRLIPLKK